MPRGQPCDRCFNSARASISSSNPSNKPQPTNDDPEVIKRATSICIIDLNRKPRGPKARKAAEGQETEPKRRKDTHSRDVEEKRGNEASSEIDLGRPSQIRKEKERAEEMDLQLPPPAGPSRDFFRGPPQVMSQLNHHRSPSGESSSHTLQAQARDSSNSTSLRSGQVSSPSNSDVRTPSLASLLL